MDKKLTKKQIKDVLLKRRSALKAALDGDLSYLEQSSVDGDLADAASDTNSDELAASLADFAGKEIQNIDEALKKMDRGEYGKCDDCGKKIAQERLSVLPYAACCITCQGKREQE